MSDCAIARAQTHTANARIVHRLDMETSGLMVMAKSPAAQAHLGKQFERRHIEKAYVARVSGSMAADRGTVDAPLRCDWPNRPRQIVDPLQGKAATTHWRVLARTADDTRVMLTPITGRSHQLRVHMLEIGHPILGDSLYGTAASRAAAPRLHLHAESLSLFHPDGGGQMQFKAAAPF